MEHSEKLFYIISLNISFLVNLIFMMFSFLNFPCLHTRQTADKIEYALIFKLFESNGEWKELSGQKCEKEGTLLITVNKIYAIEIGFNHA